MESHHELKRKPLPAPQSESVPCVKRVKQIQGSRKRRAPSNEGSLEAVVANEAAAELEPCASGSASGGAPVSPKQVKPFFETKLGDWYRTLPDLMRKKEFFEETLKMISAKKVSSHADEILDDDPTTSSDIYRCMEKMKLDDEY